jgi:hypothetical protein
MKSRHKVISKFFKDKNGRTVIWQAPNLPIYGWVLFKILSLTTQSNLGDGFSQISNAFLFVWAYLELTQGANYFRRILGAIVIVLLSLNYFK